MRHKWLAGAFLLSPLAISAGGSWSSESFGGRMTRGQQVLKSKPVQSPSPLPAGTVAFRVSWKVKADGPLPAGFGIRLCTGTRCLTLPGISGEMQLPTGIPPEGPFRFEYVSQAKGELRSPLTVLSNQMTVSYSNRR